MKEKFRNVKLSKANKLRLDQINAIIMEYQRQGYRLTLRQLYYQLVSRDVIPNQQKEYAKLSTVLKEGRMAGIVDWSAIEDRLRVPYTPASFDSPEDILRVATNQYMLPRMNGQRTYVEVWVEKDALSGVLRRVTSKYHVPIMVNRGYSSVSAMYDAFKRFEDAQDAGQRIRILYLGDFDPSGMDMIRDIKDRITEFIIGKNSYQDWHETAEDVGWDFDVIPIALTREQINQYNPPPNPAKITDPRAKKYMAKEGRTSWEVDALRPEVLNAILTYNIEDLIDVDLFEDIVNREEKDKEKLLSLKQYL